MAEIKILTNVGTITGNNGVGNVYAASESTETSKPKILLLPELVGSDVKYRYLTRDMRNWLNSGNASISTDLNLELFSNKTTGILSTLTASS
ncbi:hypothetical protein [Salmonirosea aquatica]|uniref:Uncharacterized protein n=1 Tax=Salmonirosea aquatica TaxID=2654236 RepID=A0A7C9BBY4_9BACT|nr:hypothetical protein [Cytophagaceae bacterium SJW1-29]